MKSGVIQGFESGNNHKVPTIIGTNADEGTALYWGSPLADEMPPVDTVEKYTSIIVDRFGDNSSEVLNNFPASDYEEMLDSSKRILGDSLFGAPSYFASKAMAERNEDIYFYHFTQNHLDLLERPWDHFMLMRLGMYLEFLAWVLLRIKNYLTICFLTGLISLKLETLTTLIYQTGKL